jgi:predicted alpha/beta superfamily hydrolase
MKEYLTMMLYSPQLEIEKHIFISLPQNYFTTTKRYPVLYMHDGQNLFDDNTAFMNRSWRILKMIEQNELPQIIIVGIESDKEYRSNELIPYPFSFSHDKSVYGGDADKYLDFIVHTVKPIIDSKFRTKPTNECTAIAGSSFGGVCSIYALLKYGHVFTRAASISGAFQFSFFTPLVQLLSNINMDYVKAVYLDTGTKESNNDEENNFYIKRNDELANLFQHKVKSNRFLYKTIPNGKHHESDWEKRFPNIVKFLFQED